MASGTTAEARVRGAVGRATGADASAAPVTRLAGHASARSYWRVGAPPASHVVMVMPPDAKPEEVTKGGRPAVDPFVDVQRYLAGIGVRVPRIVAFEEEDPLGGLMVLEDLGDDMLETRLRAGDDQRLLYETAVDALARLRATAERQPGGSIAFGRSFDADLYRWELHHFREWLLEAWKGAALSPGERELVDREFDRIARALDAEPKGFTHRDYQSRNIMVLPSGEQAVIDFQDALLGPRQYDLVALLRDSYVELPPAFIEAMIRRYLDRLRAEGGPGLAYQPFREVFDLLTVQRKLKDAGRFVFIDKKKGNPSFVRFVTPTIKKVDAALARLAPHDPEMGELREILRRTLGDELTSDAHPPRK